MTIFRKDFNKMTVIEQSTLNFPIFEKLLELVNLSDEIPIQLDFEKMFPYLVDNQSGPVLEFFDNNLIHSEVLRNIGQKHWPDRREKSVIFKSMNPMITDEEV